MLPSSSQAYIFDVKRSRKYTSEIKVRAWSFLVRFPNSLAPGHPGTRQLGSPTRSFYFVPWSSSDLNAISQGLKPGGFLVVKENVTSSGEVSCCNANVFCHTFTKL